MILNKSFIIKIMEKQNKINKKSNDILNAEKNVPKSLHKWIWEGLGLDLGGLWRAPGRLLATFGCLLGALCPFKMTLVQSINPKLPPRRLRDRFWVDLGRIWEGFGRDLGWIYTIFHTLEADSAHLWSNTALLGQILYLDPRAGSRSVSINKFSIFLICSKRAENDPNKEVW